MRKCANAACVVEFEPVRHQVYCSSSCRQADWYNNKGGDKKTAIRKVKWEQRNPGKVKKSKAVSNSKRLKAGKIPVWMLT